jgi:hypothetical protein
MHVIRFLKLWCKRRNQAEQGAYVASENVESQVVDRPCPCRSRYHTRRLHNLLNELKHEIQSGEELAEDDESQGILYKVRWGHAG